MGSPVQPWFHDWAFNKLRGDEINQHWKLIPANTDILVTHGPPRGYGDRVLHDGMQVGCEMLSKAIWANPNIKYNIFGHIHEGYGVYTDGDKTFINASMLDFNYKPGNPPIVFEIEAKV